MTASETQHSAIGNWARPGVAAGAITCLLSLVATLLTRVGAWPQTFLVAAAFWLVVVLVWAWCGYAARSASERFESALWAGVTAGVVSGLGRWLIAFAIPNSA